MMFPSQLPNTVGVEMFLREPTTSWCLGVDSQSVSAIKRPIMP